MPPPELHVWTCHVCSFRLECATKKKLQSNKYVHITTRHPGIDKAEFDCRRTAAHPAVSTTPGLPKELRAWQCPLCDHALPDVPHHPRHVATTAHFREHHPHTTLKAAERAQRKGKLHGRKDTSRENYRRERDTGDHDIVSIDMPRDVDHSLAGKPYLFCKLCLRTWSRILQSKVGCTPRDTVSLHSARLSWARWPDRLKEAYAAAADTTVAAVDKYITTGSW
jgi:hypothetical protein